MHPSAARPLAALFAGLVIGPVAGGCGRQAPASHQCLAEVTQPQALARAERSLGTTADGLELRLAPDAEGQGWWIEWDLPPERWTAGPLPGMASAPRPFAPLGRRDPSGAAESLTQGGEPLPPVSVFLAADGLDARAPGEWSGFGDRIYLRTEGEQVPAGLRAGVYIDRGMERGGAWHVRGPQRTGRGWLLFPGDAAEWRLDLPAESVWHAALSVQGPAPGPGEAGVELELRLDGETLWRREFEPRWGVEPERVAIALNPLPRRGARLSLHTSGPPALISLHMPRVRSGQARAADERPDLIVFLADTLRADALAAYAGAPARRDPAPAPFLDRLAARGLVFERAWSTAAWTLPSQATLLTGLLPAQHGAVSDDTRLSERAVTVGDRLLEAGYRTEAISDGAFVSATFGMHHGFELFDEAAGGFEAGAARALAALDDCDGRPLFLYFQSYAVHTPFTPPGWAREALGASERDWTEVLAEAVGPGGDPSATGAPKRNPAARDLERIYLAGVRVLDGQFEEFWRELERRDFPGRGVLLFTSDHGEAFGEHGQFLHGLSLHEEELRIPLFLVGRGIGAGIDRRQAGLADAAITLVDLGRGRPLAMGPGRSLLTPGAERPIWLENQPRQRGRSDRGVVDRGRKWIWAADGALTVFDLESDPGEHTPLEPDRTRGEALERAFDRWAARFSIAAGAADVSEAERERLRDLGYLGD